MPSVKEPLMKPTIEFPKGHPQNQQEEKTKGGGLEGGEVSEEGEVPVEGKPEVVTEQDVKAVAQEQQGGIDSSLQEIEDGARDVADADIDSKKLGELHQLAKDAKDDAEKTRELISLIREGSSDVINNEEVMQAAMEGGMNGAEAMRYAGEKLKDNKDFVFLAQRFSEKSGIAVMQHVSDRLRHDKEVIIGAINNTNPGVLDDGTLGLYLPKEMVNDKDVQQAMKERKGEGGQIGGGEEEKEREPEQRRTVRKLREMQSKGELVTVEYRGKKQRGEIFSIPHDEEIDQKPYAGIVVDEDGREMMRPFRLEDIVRENPSLQE